MPLCCYNKESDQYSNQEASTPTNRICPFLSFYAVVALHIGHWVAHRYEFSSSELRVLAFQQQHLLGKSFIDIWSHYACALILVILLHSSITRKLCIRQRKCVWWPTKRTTAAMWGSSILRSAPVWLLTSFAASMPMRQCHWLGLLDSLVWYATRSLPKLTLWSCSECPWLVWRSGWRKGKVSWTAVLCPW